VRSDLLILNGSSASIRPVVVDQVRVGLQAPDPLSFAGLTSYLESRSEIAVLSSEQLHSADVVVVVADQLSREVLGALRRAATQNSKPVVLITNEITEAELFTLVECRVVAVLPRAAVTGERLLNSVLTAASGGGVMSPNLVGGLLKHVERLRRDALASRAPSVASLTPREVDVLRLVADGLDTAEIAVKLCYSERTVKNVIYGLKNRLGLRNRSHAVAYAVRSGWI
jgi:DNA-binding NarL/FixJ family response regulator